MGSLDRRARSVLCFCSLRPRPSGHPPTKPSITTCRVQVGSSSASSRIYHKPYLLESLLAAYYIAMAVAGFLVRDYILFGYCCLMTLSFLFLSFGDFLL